MGKLYKVLIVDDDSVVRSSLQEHLEELEEDFKITHAENGKRGLSWIEKEDFDLIFLDIDLPIMTGMELLRHVAPTRPDLTFVLMTAYGRIPDAVEAIKLGAYTYLEKPLRPQAVAKLIEELQKSQELAESVSHISPLLFEKGKEMVGSTQKLEDVLALIRKISKVNTPVMIEGESGTGKELVARALHYNSPRRESPFVTVNCSAILESLFESEFFGHEKGSFTGADTKKIGRLQYAEGGTLFLDEIGDLTLSNQVKLLRVLQEKVYTPVGSNLEIPFAVRILVATHKNLKEMVQSGEFRQDLYFRLNVMALKLPSLKERRQDIPDLVRSFIAKFNRKHNMEILGWKPGFMEKVLEHDFPGNIRELENLIERTFVLSEGKWLDAANLPEFLQSGSSPAVDFEEEHVDFSRRENEATSEIVIPSEDLDFQKSKEDFEKKFIIEALKRNKGRLNQTALEANIPKKTLQRKIQKYGIDVSQYKA